MKERVLTAAVLIPLVLGALFWTSPIGISVVAALCAMIAIGEGCQLVGDRTFSGLVTSIAFIVFAQANRLSAKSTEVVFSIVWLVGLIGLWFSIRSPSPRAPQAGSIAVSFWCGAPMAMLAYLHQRGVPPHEVWRFATPVLLAIVPLWGGDTAAFLVGRKWGNHPLAPSISPKKSWEGALANLLACVAVAVPLGIWIGYAWFIGLACGLAAGVMGQLGDLFESYVKRKAGAKDSGTLLPGHGGLLDRIDSLLFTAPVVALILSFC